MLGMELAMKPNSALTQSTTAKTSTMPPSSSAHKNNHLPYSSIPAALSPGFQAQIAHTTSASEVALKVNFLALFKT